MATGSISPSLWSSLLRCLVKSAGTTQVLEGKDAAVPSGRIPEVDRDVLEVVCVKWAESAFGFEALRSDGLKRARRARAMSAIAMINQKGRRARVAGLGEEGIRMAFGEGWHEWWVWGNAGVLGLARWRSRDATPLG